MSKDSIAWQIQHHEESKELLETYDLGSAARAASGLGRSLSENEMESFLTDRRTSRIPLKKLTFDGTKYSAV